MFSVKTQHSDPYTATGVTHQFCLRLSKNPTAMNVDRAAFEWARICLTCFLLGMVRNKEALYRHCFSTLPKNNAIMKDEFHVYADDIKL